MGTATMPSSLAPKQILSILYAVTGGNGDPNATITNDVLSIPTATAAEIEQATLNLVIGDTRQARDKLLADCDWTQLPDSPLTNKAAWATYRQALRDITLQADQLNITWPTPPA